MKRTLALLLAAGALRPAGPLDPALPNYRPEQGDRDDALEPLMNAPQVREFLGFILSREGQEFIPTSAYYRLRADEVAAELAKLDP